MMAGRVLRSTCWVRALAVVALSVCVGCSSATQFGADNYRLLASLHTAVSAKRIDWLDDVAKNIAERHAAGQLGEEQRAELDAIIAKARAGEWESAKDDVVHLQKGQRGDQPKP